MNFYLVNGFLGSGKTTAIVQACQQLIRQKIRTAVITNDQGSQQVDSVYIQSLSFSNGQVSKGCFCCRYDALQEIISSLSAVEKPQTFFAESVGSCTDLVATVAKPFAMHHKDARIVVSVFADAALIHSIMKGTSAFIHESVQYIYRKQLEEADIIVVNKTDLLQQEELNFVKDILATTYSSKKMICQNSFNKSDIESWIATLDNFETLAHRKSLKIDYDTYGQGEAMLAWFDQKLSLHTSAPVAAKTTIQLVSLIFKHICAAGYTIGHLKFLLIAGAWNKKISYTTNGMEERIDEEKIPACNHAELLINARVQTGHSMLQQIIAQAIEEIMTSKGCRIVNHGFESFEPSFPEPLYRIAD